MRLNLVCGLIVLLCISSVAEARGRRGGGYSGGSTSASQNAVVDTAPTYEVEKQLLEAVNVERRRFGLVDLILDPVLHMRARRHCGWMANNRSMIHSTGATENIAMGQSDVRAVMVSWMNSSGHRANILNPNIRKIGLAGYRSPSGSIFWCQQFN